MTTTEINIEVTNIFRTVLKNQSLELGEATTAKDVEGWDSLSNIVLISEVEKHFDIKFKLREILKLKNVGELCQSIQKKISQ
ncbi:MAG: acyl carrier protein [Carboxylicivirga sp.]|jgi:acyl carrier protein|nr:acyl carrier protein [Carboxylicivirga sp.]